MTRAGLNLTMIGISLTRMGRNLTRMGITQLKKYRNIIWDAGVSARSISDCRLVLSKAVH
jgi:hypothetical protein